MQIKNYSIYSLEYLLNRELLQTLQQFAFKLEALEFSRALLQSKFELSSAQFHRRAANLKNKICIRMSSLGSRIKPLSSRLQRSRQI